jgi:ABC-type phosphate transport system auxiliary subunit
MNFLNPTWMTVAMVGWIALVATIGYVAVLAAERGTRT